MNPYQVGIETADLTPIVRESTRLSVGKWWPEGELALYEDQIEFQSSCHARRCIAMENVLGISSQRFLLQRFLEIRFTSDTEFATLRFYSKNPRIWFEQFEQRQLATDDRFGLRDSKQFLQKFGSVVRGTEIAIGFAFAAAIMFAILF